MAKKKSYWTYQEELQFKSDFYKYSNSELRRIFNKSDFSLRMKARQLKLSKISNVTPWRSLFEYAKFPSCCGIYIIRNTFNDKKYIGASENVCRRIAEHLRSFKRGTHDNILMQQDWNLNHTFVVTLARENLDPKYMCDIEKRYMTMPNIYNTYVFNDRPYLNIRQKNNFYKRVDQKGENECWNWTASKDKDGYGRLDLNSHRHMAHRIAYLLFYDIWPNGLKVCHSCDNKSCCNPKHLGLGTDRDNSKDYHNKARANNKNITWELVDKIRKDWLSDLISLRNMKMKYNFDCQSIVYNRSWYDSNYHPPKKTKRAKGVRNVLPKPSQYS